MPRYDFMSAAGLRDRIAHRLANVALRLATPWYRRSIDAHIRYGMDARARDVAEGRGAPRPFWTYDATTQERATMPRPGAREGTGRPPEGCTCELWYSRTMPGVHWLVYRTSSDCPHHGQRTELGVDKHTRV